MVGVEGLQRGRTFSPHALLLLDPAGPEPEFAAHDARVQSGTAKRAIYVTSAGERAVTVDRAVSIRLPKP